MNKRARLIVGIILMVLGVLSLMGLYLQTGMNFWTAFGVGLGASIFTIGLPCLGTFLIWGYKEKEGIIEKDSVLVKEKKPLKESKGLNITCFVLMTIVQLGLIPCIFLDIMWARFCGNFQYFLYCLIPVAIGVFIWFIFIERKIYRKIKKIA